MRNLSIDWDFFFEPRPFYRDAFEHDLWENTSWWLDETMCRWINPLHNYIHQYFDFSKLQNLYIGSSHANAGPFFSLVKNLPIISFDSHGDLGYDDHDRSEYSCCNWLGKYLRRKHSSALVVYPTSNAELIDWREEWDAKANHMTWVEYSRARHPRYTIQSLFICKSPAWTPPWFDAEFNHFCSRFQSLKVSGIHACKNEAFHLRLKPNDLYGTIASDVQSITLQSLIEGRSVNRGEL
jgi:hypothetical protein